MALLVAGLWRHEARRVVSFVALTEGQQQFHPARAVQVAYSGGLLPEATFQLTGPDGPVATSAWRPQSDPSTQLVRAVNPLDWDTPYRLCIIRQRQWIAQILLGPRAACIGFRTQALPMADGAADAPILVVTGADALYGGFYRHILTAEGFMDVATIPIERMTPDDLAGRDVIIMASGTASGWLVAALSDWTRQGGLLIAMRPGHDLLPTLGLRVIPSGVIDGGTLVIQSIPGLTGQLTATPIRLHGPVRLFSGLPGHPTEGAQMIRLGQLRDNHGTPLPYAAATMTRIGLGVAVAFPFGLAETVVLTRQGNPDWVGQDRDGSSPRRANDLFYPDHLNLDSLHVPQADELQRLLANIIVTSAPRPMPRLWYLPQQRRAAIVLTGDDHATQGGTARLFDQLNRLSPADCRPDLWDCLRASSYIDPDMRLEGYAGYADQGFEMGVHIDSGCTDVPTPQLARIAAGQMADFAVAHPGLPAQQTVRLHCIVWNGWVDVPRIAQANGIRFDMNYYSWPPDWLRQRSGFMTGSGFPMPFLDENGATLNVYQAATHMVNENGVPQTFGIASLLDRALGPEQFFGAFGSHVDYTDDYADRIIQAATARDVALISAQQMLDWLDARNASRVRMMGWDGAALDMTIDLKDGARQASVMLRSGFAGLPLMSVACNGRDRAVTVLSIKGIDYGFFQAVAGRCRAQYGTARQTGDVMAQDDHLPTDTDQP